MEKTASILVVEDVRVVSDAICVTLSRLGHEVQVANSGFDAELILKSAEPELKGLITDIWLKEGPDGWSIAQMARARNPAIFVVYVTGNDIEPDDARLVPDALLLRKPITAAALVLAIAKLHGEEVETSGNPPVTDTKALYARLGLTGDVNGQLTNRARPATVDTQHSPRADAAELMKAREEARSDKARIVTIESTLASSRVETKNLLAELLAVKLALANSQKDTRVGLVDLVVSAATLGV